MMVRSLVMASATAAALGFAIIPASAEVATTSISIHGVVPTICKAQFGTAMAAAGQQTIDLGLMTRFCNDGAGYRVVLHTPVGLKGASFVHGGLRVPLSESGETVIVDSNLPEWASEAAAIDLGEGNQLNDFNLSVQTEPKGAIY